MPSKFHARLQSRIIAHLTFKFDDQYIPLSEISVRMPKEAADTRRDRVPDIGIYPASLSFAQDEIRMTEMPLGVVEILSPQQELSELTARKNAYFRAGVRSYWLVLPELLSIYVYSSPSDFEVFGPKDTLRDAALNIELALAPIFEGIHASNGNGKS